LTGIASGGVLYNSDIQKVLDPSWLSRLTCTEVTDVPTYILIFYGERICTTNARTAVLAIV